MRNLLFIAILTQCSLAWANPQPDVYKLKSTLDPEFKRVSVSILPLNDQRRMVGKTPPASEQPAVWIEFVNHLRLYHNLQVRTPSSSRDILTGRLRATPTYQAAISEFRLGRAAFDEVRLKDAEAHLGRSLDILLALRYHWIACEEVAQIMVIRGQAFLEAKKVADAELAFRRALEIDPSIRMKAGFDHPDMVSLFERVRIRSLDRRQHSDLVLNVTRDTRSFYAHAGHALHGRLTQSTLEIRIESPSGVLQERIALTQDPSDDGRRLASRVYAGLPFGSYTPQQVFSWLSIDAGFDGSTHVSSPVGPVPHYGVRGQMGVTLGDKIYLGSDLLISASGRDFHEHLRQSITSLRLHVGGGAQGRYGRLRGIVLLGVQADRMSEVVITNNAACKYFRPEDLVPRELCDFDRDFDRTKAGWSLGPALTIEGRIHLFGQIDLVTRARAGNYLLNSVDHGFDWPVSGTVGLGYRIE